MSTKIYNETNHTRGGKFRHEEQHFEALYNACIEEIRLRAEGYMTPVCGFTTDDDGTVNETKLSQLVESIVSTYDSFKSHEERELCSSFLHSALTLLSVDFSYFEHGVTCWNFPYDRPLISMMDFRYLLENLETETIDGETFLDDASAFATYLPVLYKLLTGKEIQFKTATVDISAMLSPKELDEINEDAELAAQELEESYDPFTEDLINPLEADAFEEQMSEEEVNEHNQHSAERLRKMIPDHAEFAKQVERFKELFDTHADAGFTFRIKTMVSDFLAENGYTVFENQDAFTQMMVSLNRALKTLKNTMH